jgi:hypothetical protein
MLRTAELPDPVEEAAVGTAEFVAEAAATCEATTH